jgi:hypothetical protein
VIRALANSKGTGSVTSVATGVGLSGGTITTSGTISADTTTLSTRAYVTGQLVGYATTGNLALKLNISDTATMLSNYRRTSTLIQQSEVSGLSTSLAAKLNISDTATMLSGYKTYYPRTAISAGTGISYNAATGVITNSSPSSGGTVTSVATNNGSGITGGTITSTGTIAIDTSIISTKANVTALLLPKLNISDTSTMLSNYLRKSDTATMLLPFVQYSDTASIVSGYVRSLRFTDSLNNVQTRIQTKLAIADTATMLSGLSLDRVLANGNTSGRNLTAGNASFTTVTTNLGEQSLTTPFNIPVQNAITGTLEAGFPDSIRTYQGLRPRPWRYDGGNGNRLANTAYGLQVLDSVTEGTHPILIGKIPDTATADAEFQGRFNTAIGIAALPVARYISDFTVVGANVAASMDSGFYSTLVGHNVMNKSTNGSKVTSVGAFALLESTNIVNVDNFGFEGMRYNQTGSFNSNFGAKGMLLNSTGNYNFSGGYQGMFKNTTGSNNTNVGSLGFVDLRAISDSISDFADYSGTVAGTVKATSVGHGRSSGQNLIISGTTSYDGTYPITVINANEFYFTKTYVANDSTGWWTLEGAEAKRNTAVGYRSANGLVTGSANTVIGASATLSPNVNNNIVLSDGDGNIRLQHDSTKWVSNSLINYDYNRSGTFTGNSLVNKTYVDSLTSGISGKLNISDTAAMMSKSFRTTTQVNDTTFTINRPDGTKDTIALSVQVPSTSQLVYNTALTTDADYSLGLSDTYVQLVSTSTPRTLTLPAASTCLGRVVILNSKVGGGSGWTSTQTIYTTYPTTGGVTSLNGSVDTIISNGTNWIFLTRY